MTASELEITHATASSQRRRLVLFGLITAAGVTGCASVGTQTPPEPRQYCLRTRLRRREVCTPEPVPGPDVEADAKRFQPDPERFTLYVVRAAWVEAVQPLEVTVDEELRIGTLPRTFFRLRLPPGEHRLAFTWRGEEQQLLVAGRRGQLKFVEITGAATPMSAPYRWSERDPAGARERAAETRLIVDR